MATVSGKQQLVWRSAPAFARRMSKELTVVCVKQAFLVSVAATQVDAEVCMYFLRIHVIKSVKLLILNCMACDSLVIILMVQA